MNYCTAIKIRELLLCATWRNFTKITSREISQTHIQKDTYSMILFLCIAKLFSWGRKKGSMIGRGHEGFWGTGNVYFFTWVVVIWMCVFSAFHWSVYLWFGHTFTCVLYINLKLRVKKTWEMYLINNSMCSFWF